MTGFGPSEDWSDVPGIDWRALRWPSVVMLAGWGAVAMIVGWG